MEDMLQHLFIYRKWMCHREGHLKSFSLTCSCLSGGNYSGRGAFLPAPSLVGVHFGLTSLFVIMTVKSNLD